MTKKQLIDERNKYRELAANSFRELMWIAERNDIERSSFIQNLRLLANTKDFNAAMNAYTYGMECTAKANAINDIIKRTYKK